MAEFSISGAPENSKLPEDEEAKSRKKKNPDHGIEPSVQNQVDEIAKKFGLSSDELSDIMADFKEIVVHDLAPDLIESLGEHFIDEGNGHFGVDLEGIEKVIEYLTDQNNPMLEDVMQSLEDVANDEVADINNMINTETSIDEDKMTELLQSALGNGASPAEFLKKLADIFQTKIDGKDTSSLLNAVKGEGEPEIEERKNALQSFNIVADNESFGAITFSPAESDEELYNLFVSIYGEGPIYHGGIFSGSTKGYNLIPALGDIKEYRYIMSGRKYILLLAVPNREGCEPFMVAAIQNEPSIFELIVPEYGNTYNFETGECLNTLDDHELYIEKENPDDLDNPILNLKQPIDVDKIQAGLDNVLYEEKSPVLNAASFGEILVSFSPVPFTTQFIKVGRIKSNESLEARIFKRDFDIKEDTILFDFYIKMPEEQSAQCITALQKFLENIDFNTNPKIQSQELRFDSNGNLYINLDFGSTFLSNIRKWIKE